MHVWITAFLLGCSLLLPKLVLGQPVGPGQNVGLEQKVESESQQEIVVLRGHQRWVLALAFDPNGRVLYSGGDDGTLRSWTLPSLLSSKLETKSQVLRSFRDPITSMALYPGKSCVAIGTHGGGIHLCSLPSGKPMRSFTGHEEAITTLRYDPTGEYLASGSADDTLNVWDSRLRREDEIALLTLRQDNEYDVTTADFSRDGQLIATADGEHQIKIWDAETGEEIRTLRGHTGSVTAVRFCSDRNQLLSASWDRTLRLWDVESGILLRQWKGHQADVNCAELTTDGQHIVSGSDDKTVRLWSVDQKSPTRILRGHNSGVLSLAVSPDGKYLASGSDGEIRIWSTSRKKPIE